MGDDWQEHAGGPCPTGLEEAYVAIRTRTDGEINPRQGKFWRWEHKYTAGDIMFYRVAGGPVVHVGEGEGVA